LRNCSKERPFRPLKTPSKKTLAYKDNMTPKNVVKSSEKYLTPMKNYLFSKLFFVAKNISSAEISAAKFSVSLTCVAYNQEMNNEVSNRRDLECSKLFICL